MHSFIYSITHSFFLSFIKSLIHSFIHTFIYSIIHSLTHSFIFSLTLYQLVDAGIVGGLVLPLLGTLPDAAVIFYSGQGGNPETAQKELLVGMGALVGSNVLLMTLPWSAAGG
jgi:hypothetical protein